MDPKDIHVIPEKKGDVPFYPAIVQGMTLQNNDRHQVTMGILGI
jgi:hypothetical protein